MPDCEPTNGEWEDNRSNQPDGTELEETEVIEHNPALTQDFRALATFSEQEGPLCFWILPVSEDGQKDWRVVTYKRGVPGPVYQSRDGITADATQEFEISGRLQERVNDALQYIKEELQVPKELADQKREKRTLHELEPGNRRVE